MTLNRRALLLIFPVVLASYVFVALSVYVAQRSSILRLEQSRLSQQADRLHSLFQDKVTFSRNFAYSIVGGNLMRLFLAEADDSYRSNALGTRLQESIKSLADDPTQFISLAIIRPDLGVQYYFENSADPFAEMGRDQVDLARRLFQEPDVVVQTYMGGSGDRPLIIHSEFIDPQTFARPLLDQKQSSFLLQVAVHPAAFEKLRQSLETEYETSVEMSGKPLLPDGELSQVARLTPTLFIRITPSGHYLMRCLLMQKLVLVTGGLAMSLVSVSLLILLVRRYITKPISVLDRQLTDVMSGSRKDIERTNDTGEIGRLSHNVKELYDSVVTSLKQVQEMSWTDTLTRICNRASFTTISGQFIEEAARSGSKLTLLFIDLDNFKFVNDRYGHESGDALLKAFADRVRSILIAVSEQANQSPALFARLSGDEFAILTSPGSADNSAADIATSILALFSHGFDVGGHSFPVTASIGAATYPNDASCFTELISNADAAMYQAKASGKDKLALFYRSLEERSQRRRAIEDELRRLEPDEQFDLIYMPIVNAADVTVGCEALLQWTSPVLGKVALAELMPIAESNGLFTKIDHWIVEHAMADYNHLEQLFGTGVALAINISPAELYTDTIGRYLVTCARKHGVKTSTIEIELTETFAAASREKTRAAIKAVRAAGFRVSIDDFGAGHTSIQQIVDYPADAVKLDRVMVERLTKLESMSFFGSIVTLCHARHMSVTAEGVDTPEKLTSLRDAGCDRFQGTEISPPLTLEELGIWALKRAGATFRISDDDQIRGLRESDDRLQA